MADLSNPYATRVTAYVGLISEARLEDRDAAVPVFPWISGIWQRRNMDGRYRGGINLRERPITPDG